MLFRYCAIRRLFAPYHSTSATRFMYWGNENLFVHRSSYLPSGSPDPRVTRWTGLMAARHPEDTANGVNSIDKAAQCQMPLHLGRTPVGKSSVRCGLNRPLDGRQL